jgi:hypothetical protein
LAFTTDAPNASVGGAAVAIPSATMLQFPYVHIAAINGTKELR